MMLELEIQAERRRQKIRARSSNKVKSKKDQNSLHHAGNFSQLVLWTIVAPNRLSSNIMSGRVCNGEIQSAAG